MKTLLIALTLLSLSSFASNECIDVEKVSPYFVTNEIIRISNFDNCSRKQLLSYEKIMQDEVELTLNNIKENGFDLNEGKFNLIRTTLNAIKLSLKH